MLLINLFISETISPTPTIHYYTLKSTKLFTIFSINLEGTQVSIEEKAHSFSSVGNTDMETLTPCSRLFASSSAAAQPSFNGVFVPHNNIPPNTLSAWSLRRHRVGTTIRASAATPENRAFQHDGNVPSNSTGIPNRRLEESRAVADGVGIGVLDETSDSATPTSSRDPMPLMKVSPESLQYEPGYLGAISDKTNPHSDTNGNGGPTNVSYLTSILSSKVYEVAIESPLQYAPKISQRSGVRILLKREDLQPVFSFKLRGAYNMMAKLPKELLDKGVICSSAGNHAQGVALAAERLKCNAVIVMPVTTPEIKWKSVEHLGATVVLIGDSYDEAQTYAKRRSEEEGRIFIPPFDHPDVIVGQGTIGMEIVHQNPGPLHAIFVPVGGGGLIAGIAAYMKQVRPEVRIIGVEPADANAMALSLYHGQRVMLDQVGGFADGVAVKVIGEETFRLCRELVDGIVLVSRDAICASIKDMFEEKRSILEPAGALALAGANAYCKYYGLKDETVVAITSGANMNFERLRLVTELADVGAKREAVLATFLQEERGSFKNFCQLVGPINITEFKYRYDVGKDKALVLYSVGVHKVEELTAMKDRLEYSGLRTLDLTDNDLAKDHLRHLMGGRSNLENELLYRFVFPERPGALMKFLDAFSPCWNISLFHYRAQGEMGANVLVGVQVPKEDEEQFIERAEALRYEYKDERQNKAYRLLMH